MQPHSCMPAAMHFDKRATLIMRGVAGFLAASVGDGAWQSPKQQEIADALGIARESVNRALKKLAEYGYVERRDLTESGRGKVGCEYRVAVNHIGEKADVREESHWRNSNDLPMCAQDHNGVAEVILGSQPMCAVNHIGPEVEDAQYAEIAPMCAQDHSKKADVIGASQHVEISPHTPLEIITNLEVISNPLTPKTELSIGRKRRLRTTASPEFETAWAEWPRRDRSSKAKALAAWAANEATAGAAAMLGALRAFVATEQAKGNGAQYVPALERWLRDRLPSWLENQTQNLFTAQGAAILEHPNVTRLDHAERGQHRRFQDQNLGGHGSKPRGRAEILRDAVAAGGTF